MTSLRRAAVIGSIGPADEYSHETDPYEWVKRQVAKAEATGVPHAIFVTVDPNLAAALLERNAVAWNRKRSEDLTNRYMGAMKRGEWAENGESVIVALTGELNNGQHRLYACIKGAISFRTLMVFGVHRDTRSTLDTGKRRSMTDELYMAGYTTVTNRAGAATTLLGYLKKDVNILAHGGATVGQVLATLQDHPHLMDGYGIAHRVTRAFRVSTGVIIAMHYLLSQRNRDAADHFFNTMVWGTSIKHVSDGRARLAARYREHSMRRHRMARAELVALTIKGWNAWTRGEMIQPLSWRAMGAPEDLPTIDEWGETQDLLFARALKQE